MEVNILLIEDTVSDAELIKEAFQESKIQHHIDLVTDGESALEFLRGAEDKPHLVILDLNLPKKGGLEVLHEIRTDPDPFISIVPVIVMTNSRSSKDVLSAYTKGCNAYVRKPIGFEDLAEAIQNTAVFWFDNAIVPEKIRREPVPVRVSKPPKKKRRGKSLKK